MHINRALSFDTVLPSAIFFNKNIEPNAIKLYACVRNLSEMNGYCYAKNAYLCELLGADERSIRRWISSLVKEGFLDSKQEMYSGRQQRHLYITDRFKKYLREDKIVREGGTKLSGEGGQNCPPVLEDNSNKEEENNNTARVHAKEEKQKKEVGWAQFGKFVKMRQAEYVDLCDKYGTGVINSLIEEINDYLASTGNKPYKDYVATIRNWIRRRKDIESGKRKIALEEDKKLFESLISKYSRWHSPKTGARISFGDGYIEFISGPYYKQVRVGEHGFYEQVKNNMRKFGIGLDEIEQVK